MNRFRLIILVFIGGLFLISGGRALAVTETGTGSNVVAEIKPDSQRPGEMVTISLSGYGFDLERSYFRWSKDGQEDKNGFGQKNYTFQLGQLGQKTLINVSISYNSRLIAEKSFTFEPTDLVLSWQTESSVPPFYQGKPRASLGSKIKVLAKPYIVNPQGKLLSNNNLIYRWTLNGITQETNPEEPDILIIKAPTTNSKVKINLRVYTSDNQQNATKELILNLDQPQVILYEKKPLQGINYSKQIKDLYEMKEEEIVFQAFPLFWPTEGLKKISYQWKINNLTIKNQVANPDLLVVRQPTSGAGLSEISLQLKNLTNSLSATNRFNVKFGGNLLKLNNNESNVQ